MLDKIRRRFPWLELIWADGGYNARQVDAAVAKVALLRMEIVKRSDDIKGFVVLPRRSVVERTFSWFGRNRRLAKDFENLAETLGRLRYPRLDPTGPQAARPGVGRDGGGLQNMDSRPSPTLGQRPSRADSGHRQKRRTGLPALPLVAPERGVYRRSWQIPRLSIIPPPRSREPGRKLKF